jgi:flagella basal body P-ring formation protein FlgA
VLLLERALPRGATPGASDLRSTRRRVPGLPLSYVQEPGELRNRQLRRPLEAGTALQFDALEPAPVIRRGQAVTLITDAAGLEVRAPGEALADAAPGQRVRIRNLASLKVVEGRADEAGTVRVGP